MNINDDENCTPACVKKHSYLIEGCLLESYSLSLCVAQEKQGSCCSLSAVIICLSGPTDMSGEQSLQFTVKIK